MRFTARFRIYQIAMSINSRKVGVFGSLSFTLFPRSPPFPARSNRCLPPFFPSCLSRLLLKLHSNTFKKLAHYWQALFACQGQHPPNLINFVEFRCSEGVGFICNVAIGRKTSQTHETHEPYSRQHSRFQQVTDDVCKFAVVDFATCCLPPTRICTTIVAMRVDQFRWVVRAFILFFTSLEYSPLF